jgi:hypothetical protein
LLTLGKAPWKNHFLKRFIKAKPADRRQGEVPGSAAARPTQRLNGRSEPVDHHEDATEHYLMPGRSLVLSISEPSCITLLTANKIGVAPDLTT